ncbi:MAG TPA: helix-turn-helix domain-containing protein [Candidatus Paceibacterota bacterium]|nr:helix-turn-helix domain-containing protein [Candidatus Paceibacterota bacterium]
MFKEGNETLKKLGLKEADVKVYLACLENKQGLFVAEIAKITGIKRSTVNLILERLQERGFVTFHLEGARKRFSAEAPESLLFNFEEQVKDLRAFIPLLHMASEGNQKTKIRFFEGKEGVAKIYADSLLTLKMSDGAGKELLAISSGEDVFNLIPEHEKQFINKRIKERIPLRWIAPEGKVSRDLDKTSSQELRKIKFFDGKKYQFHVEIDVYADTVALMNLGKEPSGVIIENKDLAQSVRSLFNLIWDSLD